MTSQQNKAFADSLLPAYPLDEAADWIRNNLDPENVFDDAQLERWAENNGYVKEQ